MTNVTFLDQQQPIPGLSATIGDFWQWAYSDILSNRNRGIFAEYLVGVTLGVVNTPRAEWDAADLCYREKKIEVKASAFCQSWSQKNLSKIIFSIRKAIFWNPATAEFEGGPTRCAHIYVFCLYSEQDCAKANPLDVPAWEFYVVPIEALNRLFGKAKSISLASLKTLATSCNLEGLKARIDTVVDAQNTVLWHSTHSPRD